MSAVKLASTGNVGSNVTVAPSVVSGVPASVTDCGSPTARSAVIGPGTLASEICTSCVNSVTGRLPTGVYERDAVGANVNVGCQPRALNGLPYGTAIDVSVVATAPARSCAPVVFATVNPGAATRPQLNVGVPLSGCGVPRRATARIGSTVAARF